jgi:toluene monooxygenase system protein A
MPSRAGSPSRSSPSTTRSAHIWDVIIDNVNAGNIQDTLPATLPWLCNLCQLPVSTMSKSASGRWSVKDFPLEHDDYTYHFCSRVCRQIWWEDRDAMHLKTVLERLLEGLIQPADVPGILAWMGVTPDVAGDDAYAYRWAKDYAPRTRAAAASGGRAR